MTKKKKFSPKHRKRNRNASIESKSSGSKKSGVRAGFCGQFFSFAKKIISEQLNKHIFCLRKDAINNEAKESSQKPKQRFCTNCGAEIMEGSKFCTECGMPIENDGNK